MNCLLGKKPHDKTYFLKASHKLERNTDFNVCKGCGGIYLLYNLKTNHIYLGQSTNFQARKAEHRKEIKYYLTKNTSELEN